MMEKSVRVTIRVKVSLDETKFTPAFMENFRQTQYAFVSIDDHIRHIAQLAARGRIGMSELTPEGYHRTMYIQTLPEIMASRIED